jgi:hypothetical protein
MLEELPGRVWEILRNLPAEFDRKVSDGFVEGCVGLASAEQGDELLAYGLLLVFGVGFLG